jgi:hypothetical protein
MRLRFPGLLALIEYRWIWGYRKVAINHKNYALIHNAVKIQSTKVLKKLDGIKL